MPFIFIAVLGWVGYRSGLHIWANVKLARSFKEFSDRLKK